MNPLKIDGILEIDKSRGVVFFHSKEHGGTVLRIAGLPVKQTIARHGTLPMFDARYGSTIDIMMGEEACELLGVTITNAKRVKQFYTMNHIGKTKYTVSFHDGVKVHKDGSPFYDIALFKNKKLRDKFCNDLKKQGYVLR